jgi:hypothetical protein
MLCYLPASEKLNGVSLSFLGILFVFLNNSGPAGCVAYNPSTGEAEAGRLTRERV